MDLYSVAGGNSSIMKTICLFGLLLTTVSLGGLHAEDAKDDPLAPWRTGVKVHPVSDKEGRHTIHTYFNTCPESPDGKQVLFYTSTTADGEHGDIRVIDRKTGEEKVIASDLHTEDAHRVACQQWLSGGKRVAFHNERDGKWSVSVVDMDTLKQHVVAQDRQLGFGQPLADIVPVYGPHWDPKSHHDLDLVNVATGEMRESVVKCDAVREAYPEFMKKQFGDKPLSIFFPILSPDLKRVFFKMASPKDGDPRSRAASERQGLICYSLEKSKFIYLREMWGHPSWTVNSHTIAEFGNKIIDTNTGVEKTIPNLPIFRADHPSLSPDGRLYVTDTPCDVIGGKKTDYAVILADPRNGNYIVLARFDNSHGAKSWRVSHPHPVFTPDGKRIYFNTNSTEWTQLNVAEIGGEK